jgi:hypothetical protein
VIAKTVGFLLEELLLLFSKIIFCKFILHVFRYLASFYLYDLSFLSCIKQHLIIGKLVKYDFRSIGRPYFQNSNVCAWHILSLFFFAYFVSRRISSYRNEPQLSIRHKGEFGIKARENFIKLLRYSLLIKLFNLLSNSSNSHILSSASKQKNSTSAID